MSNTNRAHWQQVQSDYDFIPLFDNPFTSIEFGVMKPDPEIYRQLIAELGAEPSSILFFDDGARNIQEARKIGMHAEQVFNPEDIRRVLRDYRLIV